MPHAGTRLMSKPLLLMAWWWKKRFSFQCLRVFAHTNSYVPANTYRFTNGPLCGEVLPPIRHSSSIWTWSCKLNHWCTHGDRIGNWLWWVDFKNSTLLPSGRFRLIVYATKASAWKQRWIFIFRCYIIVFFYLIHFRVISRDLHDA